VNVRVGIRVLALAACGAAAVAQPAGQSLGGGVFRVYESAAAFQAAGPSFLLEYPPRAPQPIGPEFKLSPQYGEADGRRTISFSFPEGTTYYGLGLAPGGLIRNGFTSEASAAMPWVLAVRPDGAAVGLVPDTTYGCRVDLTSGLVWSTDDPSPGFMAFDVPMPWEAIRSLHEASGRMEMPPLWALGHRQVAGSTPADWLATADRLRRSGVAADALILPEFSTLPGGAPVQDWESTRKTLRERGFRLVAGFSPMPGAQSPAVETVPRWVSTPDGIAQPRIPDYTAKETRDAWSSAVAQTVQSGIDGAWLSDAPIQLPPNAQFAGDSGPTGAGGRSRYAAVFPTLFARATTSGLGGESVNRRAFTATGSMSPTLQRSAATISAPGAVSWSGLERVVQELLSCSLSGQPLYGAELPDAVRTEPDPSLAAAWIGLTTMLPVSQSAVRLDQPLTPELEAVMVRALRRRSRLIPYYYTLCFNAFFSCDMIARPLFFERPDDPSLRASTHAFFLGQDLLVVPRLSSDPKPACPLPGGWARLDLGDGDHPDLPDLYIRPGAAIPLGPAMAHTGERPLDPLTVVFNLGDGPQAVGRIYEDDGETMAFYRNQARRVGYRAERRENAILVRLAGLDFALPLPKRALDVRILTDRGELTATGSERGTLKIDLPTVKPSP
jgi:alpha-glucosidase